MICINICALVYQIELAKLNPLENWKPTLGLLAIEMEIEAYGPQTVWSRAARRMASSADGH